MRVTCSSSPQIATACSAARGPGTPPFRRCARNFNSCCPSHTAEMPPPQRNRAKLLARRCRGYGLTDRPRPPGSSGPATSSTRSRSDAPTALCRCRRRPTCFGFAGNARCVRGECMPARACGLEGDKKYHWLGGGESRMRAWVCDLACEQSCVEALGALRILDLQVPYASCYSLLGKRSSA